MKKFSMLATTAIFAGTIALTTSLATAADLREAMQTAVSTNPDIGQAVENREAVEFELRQARGLYLPSIDLEASVGVRNLDSPSRRASGIDGDDLSPTEAGITITQKLFDGGGRRAQLDQQASRVDSASFRVMERSETIALQVVREYLEFLLQSRIVAESQENVRVHQALRGDIGSLISSGTLTEADSQQADERLLAAKARLQEATEALQQVKISLLRLVGTPITGGKMPPSLAAQLPKSLDVALETARRNNPRIKAGLADVDAADAGVRGARNNYLPEVSAEGRLVTGTDIDGSEGRSTDAQVRLVARWNLYRGGIDQAREEEQIRRAGEQRFALDSAHREVDEAVRLSWDRRIQQRQLAGLLKQQSNVNAQLVSSYREQLNIGQRSLLDVLGAQNTKYNVNVLSMTAQYASLFAEYRLLASTGSLLKAMNITPPKQIDAYARSEFKVRSGGEPQQKRLVSKQNAGLPIDLFATAND